MSIATRTLIAALTTTLAVAAGCSPSPDKTKLHGETFRTSDQTTDVGQVFLAHDAAGAASDGTLYDCHFAGDRLNSLGRSKLDLMCQGTDAGSPVAVYLQVAHPAYAARRAAVDAYLRTAGGLDERQMVLAEGPNPSTLTPSAYNLPTVYKTANGVPSGEAADLGVTGGLGANGPGGTVGK